MHSSSSSFSWLQYFIPQLRLIILQFILSLIYFNIIDSGVYFNKEKSEKPEKGLRISVRDGIAEVDENFQDDMGPIFSLF